MQPQTPHYSVGIDLGTTHTVVAYCDARTPQQAIKIFDIMQLVGPGEVAARTLLPSLRYHPAEGELSEADTRFAAPGESAVIGEAAWVLGAKTQGRLVTSAKSWLSHPSVDHSADILPWGGAEGVVKVSPLHASASYLAHVRAVWNQQFRDAPLEAQDIVITVPASFDEAARALTLEAAHLAGLPAVRLLEEPQAVCYDWLRRHQDHLKDALRDVRLLLVCDVGGGTTDLTLIQVEAGEPEPKLTRIGVGDHLMLGGDNVDLALAHAAEKRLAGGERKLSPAELSQLLTQCRNAKERLLGADAPDSCKVTLLGGGAKLIGGTRATELSKAEVRAIALDGFFPLSGLDDFPDRKRSGVVEFGLPYTAEPAVSKHIAAFLKLHRQAAQQAAGDDRGVPDALLLNGGVFRSAAITQRCADLLSSWRGKPIKLLKNAHPELAVAYGAVSYAIARHGKKLRIGGGSARSYFLVVDTDAADVKHGVCILPRGSEEGEEILLKERQFALRLGQAVRFHLASLTGDSAHRPGELTVIDDSYHSLPPLAVAFEQTGSAAPKEAVVQLAATLTEIGTLQLQCVAVGDNTQRWNVEFQIRKSRSAPPDSVALPAKFGTAAELIARVFGKKTKEIAPQAVKTLRGDLEKLLGPREEWRTPLLRALYAELLEGMKNRRRSEAHERTWLGLAGFCLRPGFGYPLDDWRVEQLWQHYAQGIQFVNETPNWAEWWTLWRRVAGGLNSTAQQRLFDDLAKYLNPASARQGNLAKQAKQRSYDDMVRLAAVLERLPATQKLQLGSWLLQRLQKPSESNQTWWAVGRIGARMPFHGSAHYVLAPETVTPWLDQMLAVDWKKIPQAGFAAMLVARMSGDRVRDIDEALRRRVIDKLKISKMPAAWLELVEAVKELDEKEEQQIFGEALPPGLKLL
ncbi:MAG: Hsp70 family protein [Gammaproteobacteria bacterium]